MKKLFAIVLAVVMVMALSVSVFAEETVYSMPSDAKLGQYMGNADPVVTLGDGAVLSLEDGGTPRIATNWVNGDVFDAIVNGVKTEGATMRIVTSAAFSAVGFQSESGGYEAIDVTDSYESDGKVVTIVDCAALSAAAPVVMSGSFGGWCNFYINGVEEGTVLYSLEIVTGYGDDSAAPAETETAPAETETETAPTETETETTPTETETAPAPSTGLTLAVIPAIVAMAAVAVSKKH